jgi:hypothetical protein
MILTRSRLAVTAVLALAAASIGGQTEAAPANLTPAGKIAWDDNHGNRVN